MIASEILQSVQFLTSKGKRLAVLDAEDWEALVAWLEELEDLHTARSAYTQLNSVGGDRQKAGWLKWHDVEQELR